MKTILHTVLVLIGMAFALGATGTLLVTSTHELNTCTTQRNAITQRLQITERDLATARADRQQSLIGLNNALDRNQRLQNTIQNLERALAAAREAQALLARQLAMMHGNARLINERIGQLVRLVEIPQAAIAAVFTKQPIVVWGSAAPRIDAGWLPIGLSLMSVVWILRTALHRLWRHSERTAQTRLTAHLTLAHETVLVRMTRQQIQEYIQWRRRVDHER